MSKSNLLPSIEEFLLFLLVSVAAALVGGLSAMIYFQILAVLVWITGAGLIAQFFSETLNSSFRLPLTCLTGWFVLTFILICTKAFFRSPDEGLVFVLFGPLLGLTSLAFSPPSTGTQPPDRALKPAVIMTLIVLPALIPVFLHVGIETASGSAYRAYFNGDFLKHIALIHEFGKPGIPPENPYFAGLTLHYYWFIYPMVWLLSKRPGPVFEPHVSFIVFSLAVCVLFLSVLSALISGWRVKTRQAVFILFGVTFAMSYEGILLAHRIRVEGKPFWLELGHYNIDGYSRWLWGHPQIDSLYRSFLYTPQHLLALGAVLIGIGLAARFPSKKYFFLEAFLTGLSVGVSVFIGGIACAALVMRQVFSHRAWRRLWITLPVMVFWSLVYFLLEIVTFNGGEIQLAHHLNIIHIILILIINFGVMGLIAVLGLVRARQDHRPGAIELSFLAVIALCVFIFIRLKGNPSDMGLKSALMIIPAIVLGGSYYIESASRIKMFFLSLLIIPALPTSIFDLWSTWNIDTPRYISFIPERDRKACEFLAKHTSPFDIVQALPDRAPRGYYSLIPTFAGRRTALGDPMHGRIFQVPASVYRERKRVIEQMFRAEIPEETLRAARAASVDLILIGPPERRRFRHFGGKWFWFPEIYQRRGLSIYRATAAVSLISDRGRTAVQSQETLFTRTLIIRHVNEGIATDDVVNLPPGSSIPISINSDDTVFLLPRQEDFDLPRHYNLPKEHAEWSCIGRIVGWPGAKDGCVIQASDEAPGILWRRPDSLLPPGHHIFHIRYAVLNASNNPSVFTIRSPDDPEILSAELSDTAPDTNGFSTMSFCFDTAEWLECELSIHFSGYGVLTLDAVEHQWIAPEDEWILISGQSSPANT